MKPFAYGFGMAAIAGMAYAAGWGIAVAQERTPFPRVQRVLTQSLDDLPGREVRMEVVTFPPASVSPPHRHPGHVFVYVLDGAIESALDDQPPVRYQTGDSFYEPAGGLHRITRNTSDSDPARVLAVMLVHEGERSTRLDTEHDH